MEAEPTDTCITCDYRKLKECPVQKPKFDVLAQTDLTERERDTMLTLIEHEDYKMIGVTYFIPCSAHSSNYPKSNI